MNSLLTWPRLFLCGLCLALPATALAAPDAQTQNALSLLLFVSGESANFDLMLEDHIAELKQKAQAEGNPMSLATEDDIQRQYLRRKRAYLQQVVDTYEREFNLGQLTTLNQILGSKNTRDICQAIGAFRWQHPAVNPQEIPLRMAAKFGDVAWRVYTEHLEDETFARYCSRFQDVLQSVRTNFLQTEDKRILAP